jgi:hypothetical protein
MSRFLLSFDRLHCSSRSMCINFTGKGSMNMRFLDLLRLPGKIFLLIQCLLYFNSCL